jgi:tetratricopeptide (TPR) repeat protein
MGDYSKALSNYEKALEIRAQSLPPNHPDLGASYNNIGSVCDSMGDYSKARSCFKRAVEIRQSSLPPNHPHLQLYRKQLEDVEKKL